MLFIGASAVVTQAEQWDSEGGIVPFAYDPFSNGFSAMGATVWIFNAEDHPVPIDGLTVVLYKGLNELGSITLKAGSDAYLGRYDSMSVNCGSVENARDVDDICAYSRDSDTHCWKIEGDNLSRDLGKLDFAQYIKRVWVQTEGDGIHFFDSYKIESFMTRSQ